MATKLFIGNLPFQTTNEELETLFGQIGDVSSVSIITDKFTGRSRGFGFVEMDNAQEAQVAIERLNGYELQGRALTVNEAKPQAAGSGGGRSFGSGTHRREYRGSGGRSRRDRRW
ncbi:MAG: RNA-binding protein [Candidatus Binatia bacterium]|nr:RNA-binding protein [Candidatus Binatia bacterium]